MKCYLFSLVVISVALFMCSCQHQEKPESVFFRDFSLGATVEEINLGQLQPEEGGGSVSTSVGETTERRRDFNLEYLIDKQNSRRFNEGIFLDNLKVQIAKKIGENDVRVSSAGSNNDGFHFDYSNDENKGSIEVIGAKVEGNKYKLWCVIRESAGAEKK